jgi:phosphoribosylformylglycinamidine synthase
MISNSHGAALAMKPVARHRGRQPGEEMSMKVEIFVTLKNGVLDPQGKAIHHALEGLGFAGVNDVRAGRYIELDVADSIDETTLKAMCEQLLANTVIENFRIVKA